LSDVETSVSESREPVSPAPSDPEAIAAEAGYRVSLPGFEGPLDLLLHLCQKHELDILDIPVAFVTEKYLEYLSVLELLDLDLASEYLVMAATLVHIKSKLLLPAPPPGQEDDANAEDQEDPREALIRRLLEYQKYKQAGADLAARGVAGRDVFFRGMPVEEAVHTGLAPLAQVPIFSLVEAFQRILAKNKIQLSHDVVHERITLSDRINELVDILRVQGRVQFEDLFQDSSTRFDLVITFLALLEMTKLRMTRLVQDDPLAPIFVEFHAQLGSDEDGTTDGERDWPHPANDAEAEAEAVAAHPASTADSKPEESAPEPSPGQAESDNATAGGTREDDT
jgi:segregation and condensation protein A